MEFYNFVNANNITSFEVLKKTVEAEPYFLKIKEDNKCPDLALLHSQSNSDVNLSIVRICNGLIIDKNNLKIVCYTFEKLKDDNVPVDEVNYNECFIEDAVEGTLFRLYFYNNVWQLSTKKCLCASSSKWISQKNFQELFMEATTPELINNLNTMNCYSFILSHPENNIIHKQSMPILYHISTRDLNTLTEIEEYVGVPKIPRIPLSTYLENTNISSIYSNYINNTNLNTEGYVFIDQTYKRHKIIKNNIKHVRQLWGNNNNRFFRYLELRKDNNLLTEYINHFPNDKDSFVDYEKKVYDLANSILDVYMNKFVNKTNTIVPFYFKKIIYILHGDFLKSREQTNKFKIMNYLLLIDPKEICFMMNNIKKENDKNNVMEQ
jgi:hypothetical protein